MEKICKRPECGCTMYKAMKGCGPQVWVCSNPDCGYKELANYYIATNT